MIAQKLKSPVIELISNELWTNAKDYLNNILEMSFNNVQSGTRVVVHTVFGQVVLERLRKDLINEKLNVYIAKVVDSDATAVWLWERL